MKKNKLKLYFAHNFNNRKEFRELELKLEKELNIDLLNPFYDVPERKKEMRELDSRMTNAESRIKQFRNRFNRDSDDASEIVRRDLKNLAGCDGLFTIVEKPSFGTALEIANATLMKKDIYFISKIYSDHPWIKIYVNYRFKTLKQFKSYIKRRGVYEKKKKERGKRKTD